MTDETKQLIQLQLAVLVQTMKENGVVFMFEIPKKNANDSALCFFDKKELVEKGTATGFSISLTELNKELI